MAQNLQICQFCDTEQKPGWKCITCDVLFCDGCKDRFHSKLKNNQMHKVVKMNELGPDSIRESMSTLDLKTIPCKDHKDDHCIIYCQECEKLLCALCLMSEHPSHRLSKIEDVYTEKLQRLYKKEATLGKHISDEEGTVWQLEKIKSEELSDYNNLKRRILQKENEAKEQARKESERLISELDKLWIPSEKRLSNELKDRLRHQESLKKDKDKIDVVFMSQDPTNVFIFPGTIVKDLCPQSKSSNRKQTVLFSERSLDGNKKINFGSILKVPTFNVQESFTSNLPSIFKIKSIRNGENIMCQVQNSVIQSFCLKDSKCVTSNPVKDVGCHIIDMTILNNNTILSTTSKSSDVKSVVNYPANTKVETYLTIKPFHARGIHATTTRLLIGFTDSGKFFPLSVDSRRGILIYDHKKMQIGAIELDPSNQRIFSLPDAITTNINGDMCVVDSTVTFSWVGRLIVLGEWGNLKWTYEGHPSINNNEKFTPIDVLTTSKGLIFVTDRDNSAVHVLSMEGHFITSINQRHGIEQPLSINMDNSGKLQIGCSSVRTKDKVAKLHAVEIID